MDRSISTPLEGVLGGPLGVEPPSDLFRFLVKDVKSFYRRTLTDWAFELFDSPDQARSIDDSPLPDFRDHNWKQMYSGSILDD